MKHHEQSNLAEIFNKDFKAENLKIGKIALNAHYSVILLEEVVDIYIIDANTEDDTFAEKIIKLQTHKAWVNLAAGLTLMLDNQYIMIIQMQRTYKEPIAHFSQNDVIGLFGEPDREEDECYDFYDAHFAFACYIWYYHDLQLSIWFDANTKKIEQIQIGGLSNLEDIKNHVNSEIDLSFWAKIKLFFHSFLAK